MEAAALSSLHQLKESTKDLHKALDRESTMSRVMASDFSANEYSFLLEKMFSVYSFVEPQLLCAEKRLARIVDWQPKSNLIILDLSQLQTDFVSSEKSHGTTADLHIRSVAELAGCLYVLEGATLGGQMIAKRLRLTLGLKVETALQFFDAYGDNTVTRWRNTCSSIEKNLLNERDLAEATDKAREIFRIFIAAMQQPISQA